MKELVAGSESSSNIVCASGGIILSKSVAPRSFETRKIVQPVSIMALSLLARISFSIFSRRSRAVKSEAVNSEVELSDNLVNSTLKTRRSSWTAETVREEGTVTCYFLTVLSFPDSSMSLSDDRSF